MTKVLSLIVGGSLGTLARYFLTSFTSHFLGVGFPWGTMGVNLIGCFLAGLIVSLASQYPQLSGDVSLLLIVGFCGGFTTFSALMLDTNSLLNSGATLKALAYAALSLMLGYAALQLGIWLAKLF